MVRSGNYTVPPGQQIRIMAQERDRLKIKAGNVTAETAMNITQEQEQNRSMLKAKLSNGKNAAVKVMPDRASETALARLRLKVCSAENNCTIELKEVGNGNQTRAAYEVQAQKQARFLGLFKMKMQVQAQVDAENGEVIKTGKPWWAFLASEKDAEDVEETAEE